MINVFFNPDNITHYSCAKAFFDGMTKGQFLNINEGYKKCDIAVLFGYKKNNRPGQQRAAIIDAHNDPSSTIIIELGYLRRDHYYSIGIGNFNGRADFNRKDAKIDRWINLNINLEPLRECQEGSKVLVCGQVPWDASVEHIHFQKWVNETCSGLYKLGYKPVFRHHPLSRKSIKVPGYALTDHNKELKDTFNQVGACVTFNSNSGVESFIDGVPTISCDRGSMVWEITKNNLKDIEGMVSPTQKEYTEWKKYIGYSQWTLQEMRAGLPHKHLGIQ